MQLVTQYRSKTLTFQKSYKIYLYVNVVPRGAARVQPVLPYRSDVLRSSDAHNLSTVYMGDGGVQTARELQEAGAVSACGTACITVLQRLRIMAPSDKIIKWTRLGVQGAILSHFMNETKVDALVVGGVRQQYQATVRRALSERVGLPATTNVMFMSRVPRLKSCPPAPPTVSIL